MGRTAERRHVAQTRLRESHLSRRLFASMVCRIAALPVPAG
jgi:hypothetical protein